MSIFDTTLHIPAEQRPFTPPRTLTRITLPLVARYGTRFAVAVSGAVFMAVACLGLAVMLAESNGDPSSKYAFAALFVAAALAPVAVAVTALRDAVAGRGCGVVVVDPQGVLDARLGLGRIGWDEVREAAIVGGAGGISAVCLTLASEGAPRYAPFRIGGWSAEWHRRRHERVVALTLLDRRPHDLAHTIATLAARHGVRVEQGAPPPSS